MENRRFWTDEEVNFLKKFYPTKGSKYVANALGRTSASVKHHALKLGVDGTGNLPYRAYSPREIIFIKKNYPHKGSEFVAKNLGRTPASIRRKAQDLRVERKSFLLWSDKEIEYLKKWHNKKRPSDIARRLKRTTLAIIVRARMLGLRRHIVRKWTNDEELFLIKNFYNMTYKQIAKHLNRTEGSVQGKVHTGLKMRKLKSRKWTPKEKRMISRLYGKIPVAELASRLKRTPTSVAARALIQKKTSERAPDYTEKEKEFIRKNYLKMTNRQLSQKMKRTKDSIQIMAKKLGLTGNPKKNKIWRERLWQTVNTGKKSGKK